MNEFEIEMFKIFKLTEEEQKFLTETHAAPELLKDSVFSMGDAYKVLSTFYLAKQIESNNKSSDKHARAIRFLTWSLVVVGLLQVIIMIIQLTK